MTIINIPMKKYIAFATATLALIPQTAFADKHETIIKIVKPSQGYTDLGAFVGNVLNLAFALAVLLVLVMLVWGAFEWIASGGDKDTVGKARGRIVNALIGMAVLAVAFALAKVAGQFLGFPDITSTIPIPTPPKQ